MANNSPVEFTFKLMHETDNGYKVDDGTQAVWLPKQFVEDWTPVRGKPKYFTCSIPEWLAIDKELI